MYRSCVERVQAKISRAGLMQVKGLQTSLKCVHTACSTHAVKCYQGCRLVRLQPPFLLASVLPPILKEHFHICIKEYNPRLTLPHVGII